MAALRRWCRIVRQLLEQSSPDPAALPYMGTCPPIVFDDGDITLMSSASIKNYMDMPPDEDLDAASRWSGTKFMQSQCRIQLPNDY